MVKRQERITAGAEGENRKREAKRIEEDRDREIIRQQEREILEEKWQAELKLTKKKLEMEKAARTTQAKLSNLKISPFNETVADWVRFENMFVTQVDAKPISDEEKFGYQLEMVNGKVRDVVHVLKRTSIELFSHRLQNVKVLFFLLKKYDSGHPKKKHSNLLSIYCLLVLSKRVVKRQGCFIVFR